MKTVCEKCDSYLNYLPYGYAVHYLFSFIGYQCCIALIWTSHAMDLTGHDWAKMEYSSRECQQWTDGYYSQKFISGELQGLSL